MDIRLTNGELPKGFLHIISLTSVTVSQPIYDLLGKNAEFLVAYNVGTSDLIIITAIVSLCLPIFLIFIEIVAQLISPKLREILHNSFLYILIFLLILIINNKYIQVSNIIVLLILISLLSFLFLLVIKKRKIISDFLEVFSVSVFIFPIIFLFLTPVNKLFMDEKIYRAESFTQKQYSDIFLIVFDEFNAYTLLDDNLEVDEVRYPNFSDLAKDSLWFINATTVDISTTYAVPAILTGLKPDGNQRLPIRKDYSLNLISLLDQNYNLNISESTTKLYNESEYLTSSLPGFLLDISIIYSHIVCPDKFKYKLPSISNNWRDFWIETNWGKEIASIEKKVKWYRRIREYQVLQFVESIDQNKSPSLNILHVLLPHHSYDFSHKGYFYSPLGVLDGLTLNEKNLRQLWIDDETIVYLAAQRYLLQVGFVDKLLGNIIDKIKSEKLYEKSLIIVTADHGVSFRPGQPHRPINELNYPDMLSVALFVKLPSQAMTGIKYDYVESTDILPTIADIAGFKVPWSIDGKSMISSDFSNRTEKLVYQHGKNPQYYNSAEISKFPWLKTQLRLFGSNTRFEELVLRNLYPELLGKKIDIEKLKQAINVELEIDQLNKFENVNLSSNYLPLYISGRIKDDKENVSSNMYLGFVINGRIQSITKPSFILGKYPEFRTILPEAALIEGKNSLEIVAIKPMNDDKEIKFLSPLSITSSKLSEKEIIQKLKSSTDYLLIKGK